MPIKQVTCSICNTLVNKAVTYSVGKDQRACKTHEGVVAKRGELELERFQKTQASIKAQKRTETRAGFRVPSPPPSFAPKCWVCMNEGLRSDEFFTRVLIEREKMRLIHGDFNPFDMTHPGNQIKIGRCLFVLSKDQAVAATKYLRDEFQNLMQMSGILSVCGQCCGTLNIDPLPKPEYKDLVKYSMLYELVQPVIEDLAHKELSRAK